ncbi:MAG TPA: transporter [Burkholderiales bacterium]
MNKQRVTALSGLALALSAGAAHASCGSAFCVLNTDWATQGLASEPGSFRLDERFEFVDQKHLMQGTKKISQANDTADTTELRTINRNLLTTLGYTFTKTWAVSASVPIVDRSHSHIDDPTGANGGPTSEAWNFTKLGDIRLLGMYQFENEKNPQVSYGLTFGLKLPTGSHTVTNSEGVAAERALQPGTGSTDGVLGAYYSAPGWGQDSSWFAQALYQQAALIKDDFKPGNQFQVNLGYRQPFAHDFQGLLQVNTMIKGRDTGGQAENDLSGSRTVFISPGLAYSVTHDFQLYTFVQLPLYRNYNGIQLAVDYTVVAGAAVRF